jgi:hypothetical protein
MRVDRQAGSEESIQAVVARRVCQRPAMRRGGRAGWAGCEKGVRKPFFHPPCFTAWSYAGVTIRREQESLLAVASRLDATKPGSLAKWRAEVELHDRLVDWGGVTRSAMVKLAAEESLSQRILIHLIRP